MNLVYRNIRVNEFALIIIMVAGIVIIAHASFEEDSVFEAIFLIK